LAINAMSVVNLPQSFSAFYSEHAAQELSNWGLSVVTSREIQSLLGFERQKQLMGCSDESSSCVAELANALGVDGLILGDIAKFGSVYQVNLKAIAASNAKVLASYSERVNSEEQLLDAFSRGAEHLARGVNEGMGRPPPQRVAAPKVSALPATRPSEAVRPYRGYSWIPAVVTVGTAVTSVILFSNSRRAYSTLVSSPTLDVGEAAQLRASGTRSQTFAWVTAGLSAAALATTATMFFWTRTETPEPAVTGLSVSPFGVTLAGSF